MVPQIAGSAWRLTGIRFAGAVLAAVLWSCAAMAEDDGVEVYRPGEFLDLDLPRAVLSSRPIGPASRFEPIAVKAKADIPARIAHTRPRPHLGPARVRSAARKHRNPLDSQAFDARIQVWPCRAGGICGWQADTSR